MKASITNRIKMILLMLFASASVTLAQGLFRIVEGLDDNNLKTTLESNVNAMMMAMNTAVNENAKTVKLDKNIFTNEAIKEIGLIWKSSAISCPPVNIMSKCLKTGLMCHA